MKASDFVAHARTWIGTPFVHQGRSRFGVDCIGFPIALLRELDLMPKEFSDYRSYGRQPDGQMEPIVERHCRRMSRPELGSLILIQWPQLKHASHAAIFAGRTMIHSHQRAGGVVENGFRGPWLKNFHSAWHLPEIIDE